MTLCEHLRRADRVGYFAQRRALGVALVVAAVACVSPLIRASAQSTEGQAPSTCVDDPELPNPSTAEIGVTGALTNATVNARTVGSTLKLLGLATPSPCNAHPQRVTLIATAKYDQKGKPNAAPTITRNYVGDIEYAIAIVPDKLIGRLAGSFVSNNNLGLYLQQTYSARVGGLLSGRRVFLDAAIGPAFAGQHFITADASTGYLAIAPSAGIGFLFGRDSAGIVLPGPVLTLKGNALMPVSSGDPKYRDGRVLFDVPVMAGFGLLVDVFADYLSNTPADYSKSFATTSIGITYKIGPAKK